MLAAVQAGMAFVPFLPFLPLSNRYWLQGGTCDRQAPNSRVLTAESFGPTDHPCIIDNNRYTVRPLLQARGSGSDMILAHLQ